MAIPCKTVRGAVACYPSSVKLVEGFSSEGENEVTLLSVKNAYEGTQILVSSSAERRLSVEFSLRDLQSEEGKEYKAKNIAVYAEKYIYVDRNWHKNGYPVGNYPDALIPFENAKAYGENLVEPHKTKAFYLEFYSPVEQPAGRYAGELIVTIKEALSSPACVEEIHIPVRLEVLAATLPAQTQMRTLFTTQWQNLRRYERDGSQEMSDKYAAYLLAHRICQTDMGFVCDTEENALQSAERAYAWIQRGMTTINVPTQPITEAGDSTFACASFCNFVYALAKKSVEKHCDLLKKAVFYDWLIDEPYFCNYARGKVQRLVDRFQACVGEVAARCEREEEFKTAFGREIVVSVRGLSHLITDYYQKPYLPRIPLLDAEGEAYAYPMEKVTLCPKFDGYDGEELAAPYEACQERWWYGCNSPNAPFPSYHVDDVGYSPRIIGWLMQEWDIVGNLYWATNAYGEVNRTGEGLWLQDPYQTAHRGSGANGEGAILYPGATFDVDGPIGCLRLKGIRDGQQDYDLLTMTKEAYAARGVDFKKIFRRILDGVRDGSKIDGFGKSFERARESVLRLCDGALHEIGLLLSVEEKENTLFFTAMAKTGVRFYSDGEELPVTEGQTTFVKEYEQDGWTVFTAEYGKERYSIPLFIGKGLKITLLEVLYEKGCVCVPTGKVSKNDSEVFRELTVETGETGEVQIALLEPVRKGNRFGIELRTDTPTSLEIAFDGEKKKGQSYSLQAGWNRIELSTAAIERADKLSLRTPKYAVIGVGEIYLNK